MDGVLRSHGAAPFHKGARTLASYHRAHGHGDAPVLVNGLLDECFANLAHCNRNTGMSKEFDEVVVAVCTYRRATLSETLASLAAQVMPSDMTFGIVVIDNDLTPSAKESVEAFDLTAPITVRYVHCPSGNISIARNGALDATEARYLAFIDDDEVAEPGWLAALLTAQQSTHSDVVLGPVQAIYDPQTPDWMRQLDTHSTAPVDVKGTIRTGYSCNVLIDRTSPALTGLRFDLGLGQSGGEDTAYFTHAYRRGARFTLAETALVRETVPQSRAKLAWLARRRYRSGQTHGQLLGETADFGALILAFALASLKLTYCAGLVSLRATNPAARNGALLRGALHLGTLSGLIGRRPIKLYGATADGVSQ